MDVSPGLNAVGLWV